ncbi:hypothetical protein LOS20_09320 [Enterococcus faecium]|nr:hypothetical protein [Enterococcus faecium]
MNFLTFGNISKFYLFQTKEVKRNILKRLKFIEETTSEVDFEIISLNFLEV